MSEVALMLQAKAPPPARERVQRDEGAPRAFSEALEATPGEAPTSTSPLTPEVRIEAIDAHGEALKLMLPWGLAANPSLSQISVVNCDTASFLRLQPGQPTAPHHALPDLVEADRSSVVTGGTWSFPMPAMPAGWAPARQSYAVRGSEHAAARTGAALGEPEQWQLRWIRWLREQDGATTVRVRDYRLDAEGTQALLDRLHDFSLATGLTLRRVSVNARVIYTQTEPTRGIPDGR